MITSITFDDISPEYLDSMKLKWLTNSINSLDVKCTFFVVPYCYSGFVSQEFVSAVKDVLNFGHEVALHGYKHTNNEFGVFYPIPLPMPFPTFRRQKEKIEKGREILTNLLGVRPKGFRAPHYLHNSSTLKALSSLGFTYDSSATCFKTAHCSRFRVRWLRDCRPFITNAIIEAPVTGDYTFNLEHYGFADSFRIAIRDFRLIERTRGIFVMNNHPSRFGEREFQFLRILIKKLKRETTFHTLIDATRGLVKNCN